MNRIFLHIWRFPLLLAVLTIIGLLSALLGTGIWHFLSWFTLAIPLFTLTWYIRRTISGKSKGRG